MNTGAGGVVARRSGRQSHKQIGEGIKNPEMITVAVQRLCPEFKEVI